MKLLNGKDLSGQLEAELKNNVDNLKAKGVQPCLVVVLVGEDPASTIYVRRKQEACERLGINSISKKLPATTNEAELLELVAELNQDKTVHGILCQSPLPKGTDESKVFRTISAEKDVDCFHPYNMGLLALGQPRFILLMIVLKANESLFFILLAFNSIKISNYNNHCVVALIA